MAKNIRMVIIALVALIIAGSYFWWHTMGWTGEMTSLRPHFNGTCESVEGITGAEDIVIDRENGLAFIASHDRRNPAQAGIIWVMPVNAPNDAHALALEGYDAARFSPHGIDLWIGKDGVRRLFVVEHGDWSKSRIVVFRIKGNTLVFDHAISDPLITRPNDVAAAGENAFYVTNDLGAPYGSKAEFFEVLFRQAKGNLVYYDGSATRIVADKIGYANGVALDKDRTRLYVSAVVDQTVRFFDRNPVSGDLVLKDEINLHSGLDNIDVDEDGILWVAAHPKLLTFSRHARDAAVRSPSQVIRVDPVKKTVREIYLSLGDPLSAASVAAHFGNTLLLGSVFDPRILVCSMTKPAS